MRRLIELDPQWTISSSFIATDGSVQDYHGRKGMGVTFRCPIHDDCYWFWIPFENPIDGGPKGTKGQGKNKNKFWQRTGETFETLTLVPSIKFPEEGPEHWHGYITNGEVVG